MKIVWLVNIVPAYIATELSIDLPVSGGWISSLLEMFKNQETIKLVIVFPIADNRVNLKGTIDNIDYISFPLSKSLSKRKSLEVLFGMIIDEQKPDILHIFGTEYYHSIAMVKAAEKMDFLKKTIVSTQGLVSVISKHYYSSLPTKVIFSNSIRDFSKGENIHYLKKKMELAGLNEIEIIKKLRYIMGRTTFDLYCTLKINPLIEYFHCNEILRSEFYEKEWLYENCIKHSIFVSQSSYPIKGLHFVLNAFKQVLDLYPDSKLYIAGKDFTQTNNLKQVLRITSYGRYIKELINTYKLSEKVIFTGVLNGREMCDYFLRANVFVLASSIENSPNSLGEAMLLGVPSVAAYVGGVPDMLFSNQGITYQYDAPYMLAGHIMKIFGNEKLARDISHNARIHAKQIYNREVNVNRTLEIYQKIMDDSHVQ